MTKHSKAYGTWPSTISSELLAKSNVRLAQPQLANGHCFWLESRPQEKGRSLIVCETADGSRQDITPKHMDVRSRIHEYGGGDYRIHGDTAYFVNKADQRVYSQSLKDPDNIQALSPEGSYRYGDFCIDEDRRQLICVCEIHKQNTSEPENCIVAIKLDGSSIAGFNMLVFGNDFYSNPRLSPDGTQLSWLTWNHPYMPWDNSECWIAAINDLGLVQQQHKVAGGSADGSRQESIFQPQWSPMGELFFISDRSQWWNLYRYKPQSKIVESVVTMSAEFGLPQWVFGMSTYGFVNSYTLFCGYTQNGRWHLATIDTMTGKFSPQHSPYTDIEAISCDDNSDAAVFLGAHATQSHCLIHWHNNNTRLVSTSSSEAIHKDEYSQAEAVEFKNPQQELVHGFYYTPHNRLYHGKADTLPPLIVMCHGGPTGSTSSALNLKVQFWTNRGFAVLDVNYSGSTGYGRPYRDRLKKQWGLKDVDDICAGVDYLVQQGRVDPQRVMVRGSSAGGFSVLAALTFREHFKAGASLYGIGDLSLLAKDTHKFESRYLDQLIGPYPEDQSIYQARSPIHHVDQLKCPVIFLQGLEDKVVPPNQAETMVQALADNNIPVAYVTFPDEGHGFRQADNIRYSLEVEYAFYCAIFTLEPEQALPEVPFHPAVRLC
ncbi:MAG: S9 family peptidase [Pseudomonadota bacterium]